MTTVEGFVERVSGVKFDNCFNPYTDTCPIFDQQSAPKIRRDNLTEILFSLTSVSSIDIWVGRDLGYKGGRRTGIALTDECSLDLYAAHLRLKSLRRATNGPAVKERTASNIFRILEGVSIPVLTWNVFPLHPFLSGDPFSNRQHTKEEAEVGFTFLEELCSLFKVGRIVAIGNDAAKWARKVSCENYQVRHPSYGGQTQFLDQMRSIYSLDRVEEKQQLQLI
ncbi:MULTISPECIES: uracil-DNA glycosylase [Rhizobium/Agrobacterium group]|uniref:uracil-DNA glycosylase n=1 Tax=Rhizobium/Agrobacterium group TaxID=227290 RepID=UPI0005711747|nr:MULTISPECIES: uracil-DNA glycosylase [Rhizobium/Agrobacterium group]AKC07664.1 uracil-DNA glycosylase [Agrobacterium tumefaciens]AYM16504.1 hypothetical protein At15955_15180 [Agrobacterium tumefaciens]AYM67805.1 hypothetical protein AtA6_15880 [Agrobacterium tumefaciens]NIB55391.1 uracil-DNA glycosylase [Agrobacterium tumefaciens]NSZ22107.1 uracil-DNA glycosylase [Agrobacterium tumefaciens]